MTSLSYAQHQPRRRDDPARRARRWFIFAAVISVALHMGVGAAVYDQPLGRFDPSLLDSRQVIYRVRRARMDIVVERELPGDQASSESAIADELTQLSEALLAVESAPPSDHDPLILLRSMEDDRPLTDSQTPAGPPALTDYVDQSLRGSIEVTLPGIDSGDASNAAGGASGSGADSGQSAATMLAGSGLVVGRNPAPPQPPVRQIDEHPNLGERRGDAPDLLGDSIDFAALAVERSTQLEAPQHLDHDFIYRLFGRTPLTSLDRLPQRGYFQVDIVTQRSLRKLETMRKDVVFLIDTSGSIPQDWVDQIIAGVVDALGSLNEGDRFNIVFFDEKPRFLNDEGPLSVTPASLESARAFLKGGRSRGYTDVNRALSRLLVRDLDAQRVYDLILISDGRPTRGVMDTRELLNLITRDNDLGAGIYCVGVGRRQNREMLDFLAYRNKGFSVFVDRQEEASGAIRDLLSRLRYPIIKNVQAHVVGLDAPDQLFPRNLPDIHQGQTISLFGRFRVPGEFTMRLSGRNGSQAVDFTFTRNLEFAQSAPERLPYQWAFWKLHDLYDRLLESPDQADIRSQIDQIKRDYEIKSVY